MTYKKKWLALLIVGVLLVIIGVVMFPVADIIIRDQIKEKVIISNTSETYDLWQDVPIPVYMQFYMFHVENEEEILAGEKPFVTQHGPYTYRERRFKFNIVWNPNGTVTYLQNKTYEFVPEMSVGSESDMHKTINPLMATVAQAIKWMPNYIKDILSIVMDLVKSDGIFMTRNVSEILWGYNDPTLVQLNKILPIWFSSTLSGYFTDRNATNDGLYTVYTGESDINLLGTIGDYEGKDHLDLWTSSWANMINGSDGTIGPPFQFDTLENQAFVSVLCRSMTGYFTETVHSPHDIPLRRFSGSYHTLANVTANPDNIGFCTPQSRCLPSGLLNLTLCEEPVDSFMVPAILSFPNFLYADPEVQNSVDGLYPIKEEHQTAVDIEPWTGLVLRAANRIQINMFVEKVPDFSPTKDIRTLYFPVFWINESVLVDKKHEDMLIDELFTPMVVMKGVKITLLIVGALLFVCAIFFIVRQFRQRRLLKNKIADDVDKPYGYNNLTNVPDDTQTGSQDVENSGHPSQNGTPHPSSNYGSAAYENMHINDKTKLYPDNNDLLKEVSS